MRRIRTGLLSLCAVAMTAHASASRQQPAGVYAFVDVTVIPMDRDRKLDHQTVIVRGGRITAIGPNASTPVPAGATTIDGRGKYLMPGLGDAHAHLSTVGGGPALAERALQLYALNGVTMVRSMYTEPHHAAARERVERGEIIGPRTLIVSPALQGGNAQTPDAGRDSVRAFKAAGYPLVKILPGLSRATFDTIAVEARRQRMPLAGHVPASVPFDVALASGYESVEHLDGFFEAMIRADAGTSAGATGFFGLGIIDALDESRIPALVQAVKRAGVTIVATESEMELFVSVDSGAALARRPEMRYAPRALVEQWTRQKDNFARGAQVTSERSTRYRELRRRIIRELHAAGVPLALGSDAFNMFTVAGFGAHTELETLVAAGLSPFAALETATKGVAKLMHLDGVTGTVTVGSVADLLLLVTDPLANVSSVRQHAGVMLRGVWYGPEDVVRRLEAIANGG